MTIYRAEAVLRTGAPSMKGPLMSDTPIDIRGPVHGTKDVKRVALGSTAGAVIESYDFIGFGTAAALYFNDAFFPSSDPLSGTLFAFATLGIGFAVRPLR